MNDLNHSSVHNYLWLSFMVFLVSNASKSYFGAHAHLGMVILFDI